MDSRTQLCKRCNRFFVYMGYGHMYCSECKKLDEADFNKVRDYIYAHGTATVMETEAATEVKRKYIEQYLREGRLIIPESSPIFIKCESCGCDIRSGRYCGACASRLSKELKSALVTYEVGERPSGKMRFLDKTRKKRK